MKNLKKTLAIQMCVLLTMLSLSSCQDDSATKENQGGNNETPEEEVLVGGKEIEYDEKVACDIIDYAMTTGENPYELLKGYEVGINNLPGVDGFVATEYGAAMRKSDGELVLMPYEYGSAFEGENSAKGIKSAKSRSTRAASSNYIYGSYKAYVFNFFSEDEDRAAQNDMVMKTVEILRSQYGDSVKYCPRDYVTASNIAQALADPRCKFVYINSQGYDPSALDNGSFADFIKLWDYTFGKYDHSFIASGEWRGEAENGVGDKEEKVENLRWVSIVHKGQKYEAISIGRLLEHRKDTELNGKLVYLSSCSTMESQKYPMPGEGKKCITMGWSGVNKVGQAVGLVMVDYMVNYGASVKQFLDKIKYKKDPTQLRDVSLRIAEQNGLDIDEVVLGYGQRSYATQSDMLITSPSELNYVRNIPGNHWFNTKWEYVGNKDDLGFLQHSFAPNGNCFVMEATKLTTKEYGPIDATLNSNVLHPCDLASAMYWQRYNVETGGVYKVELQKRKWENNKVGRLVDVEDVAYTIALGDMLENDGTLVSEPSTFKIHTLNFYEEEGKAYIQGLVANASVGEQEKGFLYWEKGDENNPKKIVSSTKSNLFSAQLPSTLKEGKTYVFRAYAFDYKKNYCVGEEVELNGDNEEDNGDHEAVDLGLSVKWATMNIGAKSPEDYGDYFAWGETKPKTSYEWSTYKWLNYLCSTLTKYCIDSSHGAVVDNKTTLDPEDDAAHVNWGGGWRMPTRVELGELDNNCTWTWTTLNGVNGYKVTSKTNGNSIFLPAAGYRDYSYLNNAGTYGEYWSSSLDTCSLNHLASCDLYFNSGAYSCWGSASSRFFGFSVRAVCP